MRDSDFTGWGGLFRAAFRQSRNPMALVDDDRRFVEVNGAFLQMLGYQRSDLIDRHVWTLIEGGPQLTPREWAAEMAKVHFTGTIRLIAADGTVIENEWGATTEVVTGRKLVLFVALRTFKWGRRFRRELPDTEQRDLSDRELEIVRHVAQGHSGREIADELGISHDTVRTHVRNAMEKVGARSRAHLVAKALGEGHVLA